MNDLYIHQLETENKQLRKALQECRKALEEEITTKKKAINFINDLFNVIDYDDEEFLTFDDLDTILEILGDKENEI